MSTTHRCLIEDRQSGNTNEDGSEVMNCINEDDARNLTNLTEYKEAQPVLSELDAKDDNLKSTITSVAENVNKTLAKNGRGSNSYADYTDDQKTLFLYYLKIKFFSAAKAGRQSGIAVRTAQTWAKKIKDDPHWNIYEKQTNKVNRPKSQLQEPQEQ